MIRVTLLNHYWFLQDLLSWNFKFTGWTSSSPADLELWMRRVCWCYFWVSFQLFFFELRSNWFFRTFSWDWLLCLMFWICLIFLMTVSSCGNFLFLVFRLSFFLDDQGILFISILNLPVRLNFPLRIFPLMIWTWFWSVTDIFPFEDLDTVILNIHSLIFSFCYNWFINHGIGFDFQFPLINSYLR